MLTCTDCEENFSSKDTLKRHKYERHCKKCTITITVEGICEKVIVERKNDILQCPFCNKEHLTREGIKSHIQKSKCKAALFNERTKTTKKRNYDTAVLNACGALLFEKSHQEMVLKVVSSVNLKPVSMVNSDGEEFNVLAHESQFQQIQKNDIQSASVVAKKRLIDNEPVEIEVGLDDVLTKGVYRALFNPNEFQELGEEMCTLLNTDWSTKKHIKYSCSALLAGMIMVINSKAILVLCHEVYGRTRSVDVHREDFTVKSKQPSPSSLPPPRSPYRNIWVTTIIDNHGSKLIFGTKTFNSLVTSSIRIDRPYEPEVGPSTHHFTISSNGESRNVKIYIHKESWNKAKKLMVKPHNHAINTYDFLYQTRQIQTNFHYRSAYNRSRAASMITDNHTLYPYNIFTLSQCNNGPDISDYKTMSEVFREIALKIFVEEDSDIEEDEIVGSLKKKFIEDQIQKCKSEGEIIKILQSILNLYGDDVEIPVIKNSQLNNLLELSVNQLLPVITRVNEHIISSLKQAFSSYV